MRRIEYFEAFDGTLFNTLDKCKEYEKASVEKTKEDFKKLIVRENEGLQITKEGSAYPLAEIAECWWYAVIVMKNDDDYETVKRFAGCSGDKVQRIFNKEIIVSIGEGNRDHCTYNDFYWFGTVEDAIENYRKAIMTFNK